jgi:hypothetical protein
MRQIGELVFSNPVKTIKFPEKLAAGGWLLEAIYRTLKGNRSCYPKNN